MPCQYAWYQVRQVEQAVSGLVPHITFPFVSEAIRKLSSLRGQLLGNIGLKAPRTISAILKLIGLSPGTITLWFDVEGGWMIEGRPTPESTPIYRYVGDELAMTLLKGELTHELEYYLFTPDDYIGE